jgi:tetratricopeptide (TPR) repeat protein
VAGLIEREEQLAILGGLFAQAESGIGQLVFIGAEAGAGKSALVQAFGDSVATRALTLTGWCEPLSTPRPAGPLVDMAPRLGEPVMSILKHNDRSRLFDATLGALSSSPLPVVMVFEDVHWADETSLDLLRFLGRRIAGTPTLVIATYRDDEVGPQHPLRTRLGDLATQTGVSRFTVPALSLDAVAALASDTGRDARELWQRTGGNAFYVTELLRASVVDVPATVADAVIARSSRLSAGARLALKVAAIAGGRAAPSVLFDVPGIEIGAIDECAEAGFLQLKPPVFTFRHELVRQAVLAAIGATERQQLAAQLLDVLRSQVSDEDALARLAELAEAADDRVAVAEYAPAAARRAAGLGSHREAAAQYSRSLRYVVEPSARAELLESLALEQYLTGDLVAAIATRDEAVAMRRAMSDDVRIGDNLRWLARLHWYSGDPAAGDRLAGESLSVLLPLGPSPELAMAMSARSQWFLLSGNHDLAVSWGVQALELATTLELPEVIAHASNNVGSAELALDNQDGLARLGYSLRLSLELNAEDHVSGRTSTWPTSWWRPGNWARHPRCWTTHWLIASAATSTSRHPTCGPHGLCSTSMRTGSARPKPKRTRSWRCRRSTRFIASWPCCRLLPPRYGRAHPRPRSMSWSPNSAGWRVNSTRRNAWFPTPGCARSRRGSPAAMRAPIPS